MFKSHPFLSSGAIILATSVLYAAPATAATCGTTTVTPTAGAWECLEVDQGGGYTDETGNSAQGPFTGTLSVQVGVNPPVQCSISFTGSFDVDTSGNVLYLEVITASLSNCPSWFSLGGFPWEAVDSVYGTPGILGSGSGDIHLPDSGTVTAEMSGVIMNYYGTPMCAGDVEFTISNNDGVQQQKTQQTKFSFDDTVASIGYGACYVSGSVTMDAGNDVNMF